MSYNTVSTQWPSNPISEAKKQLIGNLFLTLDDTSSNAGDRLADEIFAIDGVFDGKHAAKGTEGKQIPTHTHPSMFCALRYGKAS